MKDKELIPRYPIINLDKELHEEELNIAEAVIGGNEIFLPPIKWSKEDEVFKDKLGQTVPQWFLDLAAREGGKLEAKDAIEKYTLRLKNEQITPEQWQKHMLDIAIVYRATVHSLTTSGGKYHPKNEEDLAPIRTVLEEDINRLNSVCRKIEQPGQGINTESLDDTDALFAVLFALADNTTSTPEKTRQAREILKSVLPQGTFLEARRFSGALSDGRDGRNWNEIQGALALLHSPSKSKHSIRFEPSSVMLNWWGVSSGEVQTLYDELSRLDFDDVILFHVVLSAILHNEKARFTVSIDGLIKMIGRDAEARRSSVEREKWRRKVWRSIVIFDSMAVYGTRSGRWKEPGVKGEKRVEMDSQQLYSRDPLIRIVGTRDTEQGTFDGSAPPKEVSIVPGEWLMQHHGNREVLSEMGNVCQIAKISRGKPSGAWAACAGLMLNQLWRERVTRARKGRNGRSNTTQGAKVEVLKFQPFTRRELLAGTIRSGYDVESILSNPKSSHRARIYWDEAIKELKEAGVIGFYSEGSARNGDSWREEWLDQPLDIRPAGETLVCALTIHKSAEEKKRRGRPRKAPVVPTKNDD